MKDERALRLLRAACAKAGSQSQWARDHGFKQQYVSAVLNGSRPPGRPILAALGLERVTVTRPARVKERA